MASAHSSTSSTLVSIVRPEATGVRPALELVLAEKTDSGTSAVDALLPQVRAKKISIDGLFIAQRSRRMVGAAFALTAPGKSAMIWPAQLAPGETEQSAHQLHRRVDRYLLEQGVEVAQSMQLVDHGLAVQRLSSAGFSHASDILYLASTADQFPPTCPIEEIAFDPLVSNGSCLSRRDRLAAVIQQTYEESLDFPVMDGARDINDVLDGYLKTGVHEAHQCSPGWLSSWPPLWRIARQGDRDIGCMLLADHLDLDQCELVYMGLIPEVRGQGWGRVLVRQGQWLTQSIGRGRLVLGVDAENHPAITVYAATGFQVFDRRSVYLKSYRPAV